VKAFIEYLKDSIALFCGIFFQWPSARFDNINADTTKRSDPFQGHTATVSETVTTAGGKVKYGGVSWQAYLGNDYSQISISPGVVVDIIEARGSKLFVKPQESLIVNKSLN
jgi:membrane protein implicated in regulation of membrane protease activity